LRGSERFADEQEEGTHADQDHNTPITNELNRLSVWFDKEGCFNHGLTGQTPNTPRLQYFPKPLQFEKHTLPALMVLR
jgi:hypothetical protein